MAKEKEGYYRDFKGYYSKHPERYKNTEKFVNIPKHEKGESKLKEKKEHLAKKMGMSSKELYGYSPVKRDRKFIKRIREEQNPDFHK